MPREETRGRKARKCEINGDTPGTKAFKLMLTEAELAAVKSKAAENNTYVGTYIAQLIGADNA